MGGRGSIRERERVGEREGERERVGKRERGGDRSDIALSKFSSETTECGLCLSSSSYSCCLSRQLRCYRM